tara:strand:- start:36 stop:215 length:180 start_codon:yes stop_codon:yes gene_type:complete
MPRMKAAEEEPNTPIRNLVRRLHLARVYRASDKLFEEMIADYLKENSEAIRLKEMSDEH